MIDETVVADLAADTSGGDVGTADDGLSDVGAGDVVEESGAEGDGEGGEHSAAEETGDTDAVDGERPRVEDKEEPEISEFRGSASNKLRSLIKQAPALAQVLKANPKIQDTIEAVFRREMALREVFPTIAEARFMRDQFPNGQADVQALVADAGEIKQLDEAFDIRDNDGHYPGHAKLVGNFFERDKNAAVAFMRNIPKEWAARDRESYNEVMGKIVGATFVNKGVPKFIAKLITQAGDSPVAEGLQELAEWIDSFNAAKATPSEEEQRLQQREREFEKKQSTTQQGEQQRFNMQFNAQNLKVEREVVASHPAIKRLEKVTSISKEKRAAIIDQVVKNTRALLQKSPSFMRKLRPLHEGRNLGEAESLVRAAWSQPWLLNSMVRKVLNKEVPSMVQQNRAATARRTGAAQQRQEPVKQASDTARRPTKPFQSGGRWYKPSGEPFTTHEVLAGKHLI